MSVKRILTRGVEDMEHSRDPVYKREYVGR